VIINYDKNNAHSATHPQFAFKTAIAQNSPRPLAPFILSENCGKLSTWRRSPWHTLHQQSLVDSAACLFWRKTSALSSKLGCSSVVSLIGHTKRVPSKLNMLPPLDLVQAVHVQTACYNTIVHIKCGDYPSFCHFSKKLSSITNNKERKKPTTLGELPFNLDLSIRSHYQPPVHPQWPSLHQKLPQFLPHLWGYSIPIPQSLLVGLQCNVSHINSLTNSNCTLDGQKTGNGKTS
jgi:hypothetical protein